MLKNTLFGLVFLSILAVPAYSDFRIATADINKIINESKESKDIKKQLDQKALDARKKLDSRRAALKATEAKLRETNASADSKEVAKFEKDARDFRLFVKDTEEELRKEFMKSNKTLTDKAVKIINTYASKNNIDLVLDKSEQNRGPVLFGQPGSDITEDVIKLLN